MLTTLAAGRLIKDPTLKISQNDNPYCNFLLSCTIEGGETTVLGGIAFDSSAERIALLKKGDALAVTGSLRPSEWTDKNTGEAKHGLSITVSDMLTAYDLKKRRKKPNKESQGAHEQTAGYAFDDEVTF